MKTEQRGRMPLNSRKNPGNAPFFTEIVIANQLLTKKHYLFSTSLASAPLDRQVKVARI